MDTRDILGSLYKRLDGCVGDEDQHIFDAIAIQIDELLCEKDKQVLRQLVETGPVWDGDILSKSSRSILICWGLASRAIVKGESGYTVANYKGWYIQKALNRAEDIKRRNKC